MSEPTKLVKLTPREYFSIYYYILDRTAFLPTINFIMETNEEFGKCLAAEIGYALHPPEGYFVGEEAEEYQALLDGQRAEILSEFNADNDENQ